MRQANGMQRLERLNVTFKSGAGVSGAISPQSTLDDDATPLR